MACFIVPAVEAAVVTATTHSLKKKAHTADSKITQEHDSFGMALCKRLNLLNNMLWGGSALLAFEHLWHGEIVPWFPFLTNAVNAADRMEMLHEMATVGSSMAILVTGVWFTITAVLYSLDKKSSALSKGEIL